jgi:hypothetical protein
MSGKFLFSTMGAGLVVGVLDGVAAAVNAYAAAGVTPDRVFKFIASGAFGRAAFEGGNGMVVWGLVFHMLIAIGWTSLYFAAATQVHALTKLWIISGLVYGIAVWVAMHWVVVPLSRTPRFTENGRGILIMIGIHMFVIGLPMAYMAMRTALSQPNGWKC